MLGTFKVYNTTSDKSELHYHHHHQEHIVENVVKQIYHVIQHFIKIIFSDELECIMRTI